MIFRERELKPYAEPVQEESLATGTVYFAVQFCDPDMLVPTVEPLVFIGRDVSPDQPGICFQDAQSYLAGVRYDTPGPSEASFWCQPSGQINHIFEYERALEVLLSCSLRRRGIRP